MNQNLKNALSLGTFGVSALLGTANAAHAQNTFFPNDTTINYSVNATYSYVGFASQNDYNNNANPTSPTVNLINSGSISGNFIANNSSTINVSGGSIGIGLYARDSSTVNLSGGSVGGFLLADYSGVLNIFGRGLVTSLVSTNSNGGQFSLYQLSGALVDGTVLTSKDLYIQNGSSASFHLFNTTATPAPSSVLVVLLGAVPLVGVLRRRRR